METKTDRVARKTAIFGLAPTRATRAIQHCTPQPRRKRSDETVRVGYMKDPRTDGLHEKSIIIEVVLYKQHSTCALLARAPHHHVKGPIFIQVDENGYSSVRDT